MKRITLIITILFISVASFSQKSHPRDREIEAAIRAFYKSMDTMIIVEDLKYIESIDISEKEYVGMASGTFESYMLFAQTMLHENSEKQKKEEHINPQLLSDRKMMEDMFSRNKVSFDSCLAVANNADSVNNFGYLTFVSITSKHKSIPGPASKVLQEYIVTKDLEVHYCMRPARKGIPSDK